MINYTKQVKYRTGGIQTSMSTVFPLAFLKFVNLSLKDYLYKKCLFCKKNIKAGSCKKYCSSKCYGNYKTREKAKKEGRVLVYRGTRRLGL